MHVGTKRIAFLGLLAAISVFLMILGSVIETNTLFLLAAAAYCTGIAIREYGLKWGASFLAACVLLGFLLAPNKIYCITFLAFGLYLLVREAAFEWLSRSSKRDFHRAIWWVMKYAAFNLMYIPALILMPKLIYSGTIQGIVWIWLLAAGQAGLWIYDWAYDYFQMHIWGKLRNKLQ